MPVKRFKPITPGRRFMTVDTFEALTRDEPEKALLVKYKQKAGRNNQGRRSMRYRGGGHKKRYRLIDFKRDKDGIPARVASIEYDPIRSAYISLVVYADGEKRYILAPDGIQVGDEILSGPDAPIKTGNALPLEKIPVGTMIHNIELWPGRGGQLVRAAGTYAQIVGREGKFTIIKLPSGEIRKVYSKCKATIGRVSNPDHNQIVIGKAGRHRWMGRRPRTRAVVMNPVDHPMGGGEGGKHKAHHPQSRSGLYAKGKKTRNPRKPTSVFIIRRRGETERQKA